MTTEYMRDCIAQKKARTLTFAPISNWLNMFNRKKKDAIMKKNEKATIGTGHTKAQITAAGKSLTGIASSYGQLVDFFRSAYRFNKLNRNSEPSAFQAVNSACYAELGVSKAKTLDKYNVCASSAKRAKAEIIPSEKKAAKKSAKPSKKVGIESSPSEEQEKAFCAANPVDLMINVVSRMKAEKKMTREEVETAVKAAIARVYKVK